MKCTRNRRKLSAFVDGELDAAASRLVEEHLDGCPECLEYLHELREVDRLVHGLPTADLSADFTSRVMSAAIGSSCAADRPAVSLASRLKWAVAMLSEAVSSLLEPGSAQSTRTLDEFSDCPPLSMSFIYFKLLDESGRGC